MPYVFWFSVFMIFAGLTLPRTSGMCAAGDKFVDLTTALFADYSLFYYFLLWFILLALSLAFIVIHGVEYVNWPRLLPLSDIVHYDGPGFRSGNHGKGFGIPSLDPARLNEKMTGNRKRAGSKLGQIEMGEKSRID